jgi:hypothetical protein
VDVALCREFILQNMLAGLAASAALPSTPLPL